MKKKSISIIISVLLIFSALSPVYAASVVMYSADGRTIEVLDANVEAYKAVGWYTEPPVLMYAADGRTLYVIPSEVNAYKAVGWYTEPPILMYAADGRMLYVIPSEIEAYKAVGWYTEPVTGNSNKLWSKTKYIGGTYVTNASTVNGYTNKISSQADYAGGGITNGKKLYYIQESHENDALEIIDIASGNIVFSQILGDMFTYDNVCAVILVYNEKVYMTGTHDNYIYSFNLSTYEFKREKLKLAGHLNGMDFDFDRFTLDDYYGGYDSKVIFYDDTNESLSYYDFNNDSITIISNDYNYIGQTGCFITDGGIYYLDGESTIKYYNLDTKENYAICYLNVPDMYYNYYTYVTDKYVVYTIHHAMRDRSTVYIQYYDGTAAQYVMEYCDEVITDENNNPYFKVGNSLYRYKNGESDYVSWVPETTEKIINGKAVYWDVTAYDIYDDGSYYIYDYELGIMNL